MKQLLIKSIITLMLLFSLNISTSAPARADFLPDTSSPEIQNFVSALGITSAVLSFASIFQIVKSYQYKTAQGVSYWPYAFHALEHILYSTAVALSGADPTLIISPALSALLDLVVVIQTRHYNKQQNIDLQFPIKSSTIIKREIKGEDDKIVELNIYDQDGQIKLHVEHENGITYKESFGATSYIKSAWNLCGHWLGRNHSCPDNEDIEGQEQIDESGYQEIPIVPDKSKQIEVIYFPDEHEVRINLS